MQNIKWNEISKHEKSADSPGFLLWKTQIIWRRIIEKKLREHNLTHPQFVVLASVAYLTKNKQSITQVELASHTSCDINTTSQVLRGLESKELIKRINQFGNEKAKYPFLTEEGNRVLKSAIKTVEDTDHDFFSPLDTSELDHLKAIFLKLSTV